MVLSMCRLSRLCHLFTTFYTTFLRLDLTAIFNNRAAIQFIDSFWESHFSRSFAKAKFLSHDFLPHQVSTGSFIFLPLSQVEEWVLPGGPRERKIVLRRPQMLLRPLQVSQSWCASLVHKCSRSLCSACLLWPHSLR